MRQIFSLPTAKDANAQSKSNYDTNTKNELERTIQNAISKGDTLIVFFTSKLRENPSLVAELVSLGYRVGDLSKNETYTSVSWSI